jgi:DUF1365 family protein
LGLNDSVSIWDNALLDAKIWHARRGPKGARQFTYHATYAAVSPDAIDAGDGPIAVDRWAMWRIRRRDYGAADESLRAFADRVIGLSGLNLTLVTLPRGPFYGFNPVSFWMARDDASALRAVIAEVSNTFGERHFYLIRHPDLRPITPACKLMGEKVFHVSPFLPRDGAYTFRFDARHGKFGAWIDWSNGETSLRTSLTGQTRALTKRSAARAALIAPFQTMRIMALILYQALQLYIRGHRFYPKPDQMRPTLTPAESQPHVSSDAD